MVRERSLSSPDGVAMRDKRFGIWQERTWTDLWEEIGLVAHGLLALGVQRGDVVSIHSEDRPEWVIFDLAAIAIRAMSTGLYPTNPAAEVQYLVNDSGARVHLAEDQEQVDKVVESGTRSVSRSREDRLPRTPRSAVVRRRPPSVLGRLPRSRPHPSRAASQHGRGRNGGGGGGRHHDARLHLGHHRPAEGCDADQRQRRRSPSTSSSSPRIVRPMARSRDRAT